MALNIGTLVGYLQLDDSNFNRKADNADRKLSALKLHLEALKRENPKISVEVDAQTAKIDELKAKIADLKVRAAEGADVRVDITAAMVELDRVQTKVRELHNATIRVDVDDTVAKAKLDGLQARVDKLSKWKGPGWRGVGLAAGIPATVTALGAATGAVAALGSGVVTAASGVGVLKLALHGLGGETQALMAYKAAMEAATTAKQRQAAKLALDKSAFGRATKPSQAFASVLVNQGAPALSQLQSTAQRAVFPGMTAGLRDLITLLPVADRLVTRIGSSLGTMSQEAAKALTGPFWTQWLDWLGRTAHTDLPLWGSIFGNTFEGVARILQRFGPQGVSLLQWLDDVTKRFDTWTQGGKGSSFESFMKTVTQDGSAVAGVLRPLGHDLAEIGKGLNSFGVGELKALGDTLSILAKFPPGILKGLGVAIPALLIGSKGLALGKGLLGGVAGISGLLGKVPGLGKLGKLGSAVGSAGAVHVWVDNPGFGGIGGIGGGGGEGTTSKVLKAIPLIGAAAAAITAGFAAQKRDDANMAQFEADAKKILVTTVASAITAAVNAGPNLHTLLNPGQANAGGGAGGPKGTTTSLTWSAQLLLNYSKQLKAVPKSVVTKITTPGAISSYAQIEKLAQQYHLTPKQVRTLVALAGVDQALSGTQQVRIALDSLHNRTVVVNLVTKGAAAVAQAAASAAAAVANIAGQHPGAKKALGGIIAGIGSGTSDSIPAMLSNGEFVVNAAATKRNRGLLEAINAQHFAKGGSVHHVSPQRAAAQKRLAYIESLLSQAQQFGSSFAPNVFAAGLPTTKDVTTPGGISTSLINGQVVTTRGAGTTTTVNLTNQQILAEMLTYAKQQAAQDATLARNVKKLKAEGLSSSLIAQMQSAGPQGIAQINALASGTRAQVQQFNALNASATKSLNNAGAQAAAGTSFASLKQQQAQEAMLVRGIHKALQGTTLHVTNSKARVQ